MLRLIVFVILGYATGNVLLGLLASMLVVNHAIPPDLRIPLGVGGGLLGAAIGGLQARAGGGSPGLAAVSRLLLLVAVFTAAVWGGWWLVGATMDHGAGPHPWLRTGSPLVYFLQALGAFGGFVLAGKLMEVLSPPPPAATTFGSARFSTGKEAAAGLGGEAGLIVGRFGGKAGRLMRYAGPAHLLTIAPTRSGKGVGALLPNLLLVDRSVLCIDPKGENARISARARARFGPVHVLDPFGASGLPSAAFNPLEALDPHSLDLAEDVAVLADALVFDPPGQVGDAHWNEEAKALLGGVILHVVCDEIPARRTLATVRERLTSTPDAWASLLTRMSASSAANGLVARAANRQFGKSEREAAGVLSSAQRHTHFLDSPRMTAVLGSSDFRFEDLKERTSTVFLVLPPDRLATHARWLRLMVVQALNAVVRSPARPPEPVLFLLDEFAALGRLEPIERAFGLMAGYGLQLWAILQDMHQLRSLYGERAGTFLSNAGLTQIFNVADVDTATWVSRTIGATTVEYWTSSNSESVAPMQWGSTKGSSTSAHLVRRDLMTPDEVMRLDPNLELLLRPGEAPVVGIKLRHYADPEFRALFEPA